MIHHKFIKLFTSAPVLRTVAAVGVAFLTQTRVSAATKTWTDPVDGDWSDGARWTPPGAPSDGDDVIIVVSGADYTVRLDTNATVSGLSLGAATGTNFQTLSLFYRTNTFNGVAIVNANGILSLTRSAVASAGTITNRGRLRLEESTLNATLVNQGQLGTSGYDNLLEGPVQNQAGATFELISSHASVSRGFTNFGVIELKNILIGSGSGLSVGGGPFLNAVGGQINARDYFQGPPTHALGGPLDNRGVISIAGELYLSNGSADILNSGTITINGGRTLSAHGGTFLNRPGGTIQGGGTLDTSTTAFTNDGMLDGRLVLVGNFSQTSNGIISIEGNSSGLDQFRIAGKAAFGGTLRISPRGGPIQPIPGQRFPVLQFNSHDEFFDHMEGLDIGGGFFLQPIFSATNVVLMAVSTRPDVRFESSRQLPGGQIEFRLSGTAGRDLVVQGSPAAAPTDWTPVLTNTSSGAAFHFVVEDLVGSPQRFFRVLAE